MAISEFIAGLEKTLPASMQQQIANQMQLDRAKKLLQMQEPYDIRKEQRAETRDMDKLKRQQEMQAASLAYLHNKAQQLGGQVIPTVGATGGISSTIRMPSATTQPTLIQKRKILSDQLKAAKETGIWTSAEEKNAIAAIEKQIADIDSIIFGGGSEANMTTADIQPITTDAINAELKRRGLIK